jgi:hypothetical protein
MTDETEMRPPSERSRRASRQSFSAGRAGELGFAALAGFLTANHASQGNRPKSGFRLLFGAGAAVIRLVAGEADSCVQLRRQTIVSITFW